MYKITDIRRGVGGRSKWVYAKLVNSEDSACISATLPYILAAIKERGYQVDAAELYGWLLRGEDIGFVGATFPGNFAADFWAKP